MKDRNHEQLKNGHYPWYDSDWLAQYTRAREVIAQAEPANLTTFVRTFDGLRTNPDFVVPILEDVFDDGAIGEIEALARTLKPMDLEMHEVKRFGRFVVHDHPTLTELQRLVIEPVSEAAGEPLDPSYNFLSLYTGQGVCPVHLDAPAAKWTLDLCIRQSRPWPIQVSQVVPWPEGLSLEGDGWDQTIKSNPEIHFKSYSLEPGQAILFSGSSQWHYRDTHPGGGHDDYCDLAFFHFAPKGMAEAIDPANWARLFGVPELADLEARWGG